MSMTLGIERRERGPAALAVGAVLLLLAGPIVAWFHLDHLRFNVCTFKAITGIPCMTCGTTRSLGRLAVLDVAGAFRINPLASLALIVVLVFGLADLLLLPSGRTVRLRTSAGEWRLFLVVGTLLLFVNWAYLIATGV